MSGWLTWLVNWLSPAAEPPAPAADVPFNDPDPSAAAAEPAEDGIPFAVALAVLSDSGGK